LNGELARDRSAAESTGPRTSDDADRVALELVASWTWVWEVMAPCGQGTVYKVTRGCGDGKPSEKVEESNHKLGCAEHARPGPRSWRTWGRPALRGGAGCAGTDDCPECERPRRVSPLRDNQQSLPSQFGKGRSARLPGDGELMRTTRNSLASGTIPTHHRPSPDGVRADRGRGRRIALGRPAE